MPTVNGPVSEPLAPLAWERKDSAASRVDLANGSNFSPAGVTMTLRVERSISWTPRPVSNATSAWERDGCEMDSLVAAVPKCLHSAMVTKDVSEILDYRQIAKIQSTYVKGLLDVIQPDGRVHTRYLQTLTATGRLSSVDPNLQNIPTRTEEGKQIRKAFVPSEPDGYIFSCDYSQVELRVLAHVSGDQNMQEAFKTGYDIHSHTAMKIFHLDSPDQVTPLMRRHAKAVNFGIVYGISDYGLSKNLGISRKRAQEFIDNYFEQYPQIKDYMNKAVQEARDKGYAETIMHRRRYLPDIHAKKYTVRAFAERTAINSPIQGSAADIIKIAMINMQKKLDELHLKTKMVVQVHDELIFDVPKDELETIKKIVPEVMQSAVKLDVPLIADSGWGHNWYDAK